MIEFGTTCIDVITEFKGVVTGRCSYITGCEQVLLSPVIDKNGARREPQWFDAARVRVTDHPKIELPTQPESGPDIPAPVR